MLVVCKILRTGENSKMFSPYNPWMLGLYAMLIEYRNYYLGQNPDTDKIINNEIQLVLKNRNADMEHLRESTLFRDFDQKNIANRELVYLHNKIVADPYIILPEIPVILVQNEIFEEAKDEEIDPSDQYSNSFDQDKVIIEESCVKYPNLSPEFLKVLANQGINQAMREIIDAVIRRVIPIASITTRLLILKDFALEPDPEKLREASQSTVKSLAGMLAQITCKDILKYQFAKSLKDLVLHTTNSVLSSFDEEDKKELIETIIRENSEIGCKKIISAVQKDALKTISKEDSIVEAISKRERYQKDGTDFRDLSNMANFNKLPGLLKPSENGLTEAEFQVYKDFDGIQDMVETVLDEDPVPMVNEEIKASMPQGSQEQQITIQKFISLCYSYTTNEQRIVEFNTTFKKEIAELQAMISQLGGAQELITENFLNQKKDVALNSSLLASLIENGIISVESWQKLFSFFLKQSIESINDQDIIDFIELFVVKTVFDKGCVSEQQIPDLLACIESFSETKQSSVANRWRSIGNLFKVSALTTDIYEDISSVYYDQWVNAMDLNLLRPKF
jgi:hypothetical protein